MATKDKSIGSLAELIHLKTKALDDYISSNSLTPPSFGSDGPLDFPIPPNEQSLQETRRAVINATSQLQDLLIGPRERMRWLAWTFHDNLALQALTRFNIPSAVPLSTPISFQDLASKLNLQVTTLTRILRLAFTLRIFHEPSPGLVAHTAASRALLEDPSLADWVGFVSDDCFPGAAHACDALEKWPGSEEVGETGFALAHGKSVFELFETEPGRARRMGGAMTGLSEGEGYQVRYSVEGYPWEEVSEGTMVDMGGSTGFVCIELARKYPNMHFIVQDLPKTVATAHVPKDLEHRIELQGHDFFMPQPVYGADVYFFRLVLHNWSDKYVIAILKNLIPALKPGARIIVNDDVLPHPGVLDEFEERMVRNMDLGMLHFANARSRTLEDFVELFTRADERFKFSSSRRPEGARMYMLEFKWDV